MIHLTGPGPGLAAGGLAPGQIEPHRDAQAAQSASQKALGATPGDSATLSARPVVETGQSSAPHGPHRQHPGEPAAQPDRHRAPVLTGPRPTFERTPLEKLRSDAIEGVQPDAPDDAAPDTPLRERPAPDEPAPTATAENPRPGLVVETAPPENPGRPGPPYDDARAFTTGIANGKTLNTTR